MSNTTRWRSYCEELARDLDQIEEVMVELLDRSTILNVDPNRGQSDVFFVGAAKWGWEKSDDAQTRLQMRGIEAYGRWFSRFRFLFRTPTPEVKGRLDNLDDFIRGWFERGRTDHSIPSDMEAAKTLAHEQFDDLRGLLGVACASGSSSSSVVAVPDTNALIDNPNLAAYGAVLSRSEFEVRLMPTVLGEIDDLKRSGRTELVRDGARRADRMLKGLRIEGTSAPGRPSPSRSQPSSRSRSLASTTFHPGWTRRSLMTDSSHPRC
jgi:PIN domain